MALSSGSRVVVDPPTTACIFALRSSGVLRSPFPAGTGSTTGKAPDLGSCVVVRLTGTSFLPLLQATLAVTNTTMYCIPGWDHDEIL
jgi:hypothetical protein